MSSIEKGMDLEKRRPRSRTTSDASSADFSDFTDTSSSDDEVKSKNEAKNTPGSNKASGIPKTIVVLGIVIAIAILSGGALMFFICNGGCQPQASKSTDKKPGSKTPKQDGQSSEDKPEKSDVKSDEPEKLFEKDPEKVRKDNETRARLEKEAERRAEERKARFEKDQRARFGLREPLNPKYLSLETVIEKISKETYKNVVVFAGEGISRDVGVPDFRVYGDFHKRAKELFEDWKLDPEKMCVSKDLLRKDFFNKRPEFFAEWCKVNKALLEEKFELSYTHRFFKFLQDRGQLERIISLNIDGLEADAGVETAKLSYVYGAMRSTCLEKGKDDLVYCANKHTKSLAEFHKKAIEAQPQPLMCDKTVKGGICDKPMKPPVVFYGDIPNTDAAVAAIGKADLLVIVDSSLDVDPVNNLPELRNKEKCDVLVLNQDLETSKNFPVQSERTCWHTGKEKVGKTSSVCKKIMEEVEMLDQEISCE